MGSYSFIKLQVWCHWTNCTLHLNSLSIIWAPHGALGLMVLNDETWCCLTPSLPASDPGSTIVWGSKGINYWPQLSLFLDQGGYPSKQWFSTRVPPEQSRGSPSAHSNPRVYFIIVLYAYCLNRLWFLIY